MNNIEKSFVNYAHRGASSYAPENTMLAFYTGIYMGANGIETDVQITRDGVPVLFHDDNMLRLTGVDGKISDYTLEELKKFTFKKNSLCDKIATLEDFLNQFSFRDITLAIEIKQAGIETRVAEMIRKYSAEKKTVITSFMLDSIRKTRECAPELRTGFLTSSVSDALIEELKQMGVTELCPNAEEITSESVIKWHACGFNVRAWGVKNEEHMKKVYDAGADGMTVNFPDKLAKYINERSINCNSVEQKA